MTKYYILAIGGTGSRIAESFVYYTATGAFNVPGEIAIYVIDKDDQNGNIRRLRNTVDSYNSMRTLSGFGNTTRDNNETVPCMLPAFTYNFFDLDCFLAKLANNFDTYGEMANSSTDTTLLNMFHTQGEQDTPLDQGFWGHPNLGAPIANQIFNTDMFNDNNPMFKDFRGFFTDNASADINIVITGSIFGGTGATFFPNIAKKIRESIATDAQHSMYINGVLMLPYYKFPIPDQDVDAEAGIAWKSFRKKAAVALRSYEKRGDSFVKVNSKVGSDGYTYDFDTLQLVGSSVFDEASDAYHTGGEYQVNAFRIPDLFAAASVSTAFKNALNCTNPELANIFLYNHGFEDAPDVPIDVVRLNNLDNETAPGKKIIAFTELVYAVRAFLRPQVERDDISTDSLLTGVYGKKGLFDKNANVDVDALRNDVRNIDKFCEAFLKYVTELFGATGSAGMDNDVRFLDIEGLKALLSVTKKFYEDQIGAKQLIDTIQADSFVQHINPDPDSSRAFKIVQYDSAWRTVRARNNASEGLKRILEAFYATATSNN